MNGLQKRYFTLFALSSLLLTTVSANAATIADSSIQSVTVYPDRAIVTRVTTLDLMPGHQEIFFKGLPVNLFPDSLQVSGNGSAQATILDVQATPTQLKQVANARIQEILTEIRDLKEISNTLNDRSTVLQDQRDYYEKIKTATTSPSSNPEAATPLPSIEEWEKLVSFYGKGIHNVLSEIRKLNLEKEEVTKKIEALQRQLNTLQAPSFKTVNDVSVKIEVKKAGSIQMNLEYMVPGAHWSPTYDSRVNSNKKLIELNYSATIRQSTGEDWSDVSLTLSTARPSLSGTPPELYPWVVDKYEIALLRQSEAESSIDGRYLKSNTVTATHFADGMAAPMEEMAYAGAEVATGLTSATFIIPFKANIPSDNTPHKVAVTTIPLTGDFAYLTIPKLNEQAFLQAKVSNKSEYPILAGSANLYLDGIFIGRSYLKAVMPNEEFDLSLGSDENILVERKLIKKFNETTGLISTKAKVTYEYLITIENKRSTVEKIVLQDQIPSSANEEIIVKLITPPEEDIEIDEEKTLTWNLILRPGEKREIPLTLSVEYPKDWNISGLE